MSIVEEYWAGVLQRLDAEVHVFAQLIAHEGERGAENEAALSRLLQSLVPARYGIGSGLLIDNADHYSHQTDIVIFDQSDEPSILAQTAQLLFPVESVLAAVEVKTTLRGDDLADCFKKASHLRSELVPARHYPDGSTHPTFIVLAYRAGQKLETIATKLHAASPSERPDLLCIVEQGFLMGAHGTLHADVAGTQTGIALMLDGGELIELEPTGPDLRALFKGRSYPLIKHRGRFVLVSPSTALLLFVETLVRLIAKRQGRPDPILSLYVPRARHDLVWLDESGAPRDDDCWVAAQ